MARIMTTRSPPRRKPSNAAALKALDKLADLTMLQARWRVICQNAPYNGPLYQRAMAEVRKAAKLQWDAYCVVSRALGRDPDDDAPQPERHWDAGA